MRTACGGCVTTSTVMVHDQVGELDEDVVNEDDALLERAAS
jgi:hypothetical protein